MKNFDIDKVWFSIRKSTPKQYSRMCVYKQRNGTFKITLTSSDKKEFEYYGKEAIRYFCSFINHECIHIIISEFEKKENVSDYDSFLEHFKRYTNEKIIEDWI